MNNVSLEYDEIQFKNTKEILHILPTNDTLFLDFGRVKYIDSSGLGLLLKIRSLVNGKLYIYNTTESVTKIMDILHVFKLYTTFEDAYTDAKQHGVLDE